MATMQCPSCGRDVAVSEALYCPFCGQTLRRVFADGSTSAPQETPAPVPVTIPTSTVGATSSASSPSRPPASWTPYPEQSAFQTAPAAEQPAAGPAPAAQVVRNQSVVMSALTVIVIGALLIFERTRIAQLLSSLPGSSYLLRYILYSELPYLVMALAASYWLAWLRLSQRRPSKVTVEATALGVVILLAGPILIILALRVVGPSYYRGLNPIGSWTYYTAHASLFVWMALLSLAFGALGVQLANSCAEWSLMRHSSRPTTPVADFFKVFGACALLLIAAALIVNWVRFGSITMGADLTILAALVVATLLAVRSGRRRLGAI